MGSSEHLTTLRCRTPKGERNLYYIEFVINTNKMDLTLWIKEQTFFSSVAGCRTEMKTRLKNAFVLSLLNGGSLWKPHECSHISRPIGLCWFEKKNCLLAFSTSHFIWNILILNPVLRGKKLITSSSQMTFSTKTGLNNPGFWDTFILRKNAYLCWWSGRDTNTKVCPAAYRHVKLLFLVWESVKFKRTPSHLPKYLEMECKNFETATFSSLWF